MAKSKRITRTVVGKIDPKCLYTRQACYRYAGLGDNALSDARRSGKVTPYYYGRFAYYRGDQLIEWILSQATTKPASMSQIMRRNDDDEAVIRQEEHQYVVTERRNRKREK